MKYSLIRRALIGAGLIAVACYVGPNPPDAQTPPHAPPDPAMTPASAITVSVTDAAARLSEASCDREARCNNVGPRAKYATLTHCRNLHYDHTLQRLHGCNVGVGERELSTCLADTRADECRDTDARLQWFDREPSCRAMNLCVR